MCCYPYRRWANSKSRRSFSVEYYQRIQRYSLSHIHPQYPHCYLGIIPHLCSRMHLVNLPVVLDYVIQHSGLPHGYNDVDGIAVTVGPGLDPCLNIGLQKAKELCKTYHKSLIPIHHMEGHSMISLFPV